MRSKKKTAKLVASAFLGFGFLKQSQFFTFSHFKFYLNFSNARRIYLIIINILSAFNGQKQKPLCFTKAAFYFKQMLVVSAKGGQVRVFASVRVVRDSSR